MKIYEILFVLFVEKEVEFEIIMVEVFDLFMLGCVIMVQILQFFFDFVFFVNCFFIVLNLLVFFEFMFI